MKRKRKSYKLPLQPNDFSTTVYPSSLIVRFPDVRGAPGEIIDFSAYERRARMAAELAYALCCYAADLNEISRQGMRRRLGKWFCFLDEYDPGYEAVLSVSDVSSATLRAYIAWLDRQSFARKTRSNYWLGIKQLMVWFLRHQPDWVQADLEPPFNPFPRRNMETQRRAALGSADLKAILQACRDDIEASWEDFQRGRSLLARAGLTAVAAARPCDLDFNDLGVLLALIANRFDGIIPGQRQQDLGDKTFGKLTRAVKRHGGIRRVSRFLHANLDTIVPYIIAIAAQTFANPEALRNFRRDCMIEHVMLEGRILVTWGKGRAGQIQRRSFLRDRSLSVPNLIDRVLALTEPLVSHAPASQRDKLFLFGGVTVSRRIGLISVGLLVQHVQQFIRRHDLRDINGAALAFTLASFRTTGLTLAHAALGYDLTKTQVLANHISPRTTQLYVDQPLIKEAQAAGLARLQARFVEAVRQGVAEENHIDLPPEVDRHNATASGFVCADPFAGIAPGQRKDRLCTAWLGCFTCPNAIIPLDVDTLSRLLCTRVALLIARETIVADRWRLLYAPKLEILERDVLPRFPAEIHAVAQERVDRMPFLPSIE